MFFPKILDARIRKFLEGRGWVWLKGDDPRALSRRKHLLTAHNIDLVIDVGANIGQYGKTLREIGYAGRIVSFEPMRNAWLQLKEHADSDLAWTTIQMGLAEKSGEMVLHVAGNSISSSVLDMLPAHQIHAPKSHYIRDERIAVSSLDSMFDTIRGGANAVWLKIDVQGFEDRVLAGAKDSVAAIDFIQMELSLTRLYGTQLTYIPACQLLDSIGFDLVGIEPGFMNPDNGVLFQFDGIFRRRQQSQC